MGTSSPHPIPQTPRSVSEPGLPQLSGVQVLPIPSALCSKHHPASQFRPLLSSQLTAQPSWPPAPPLCSVPIHIAFKVLFPKRNLATCTLNSFGISLLQSRPSPRPDWQELHDLPSLSCPHQVSALSPHLPTHPPGGCASLCAPHSTWNPPLLLVSSLPTSVIPSRTCPSTPNLAQELLPCAPRPFSYTEPPLLSSHPAHSQALSSAS